ncbi:unnamed protein product [Orchesella dallaii]|uniref:Bromo domain-containing protein n=1 Tax=Orchesella dallaii TaxID=48710 RepID=A0ABP1Q1L8_9HEXA
MDPQRGRYRHHPRRRQPISHPQPRGNKPTSGPSRYYDKVKLFPVGKGLDNVANIEGHSGSGSGGGPNAVGVKSSSTIQQPKVKREVGHPRRWTNQLEYLMKTALPYLIRRKTAQPFLHPVDPVAMKIPDYFNFIKHPMDIDTVRKRLRNQFYQSASECLVDFQRMFCNAYVYNSPRSQLYTQAESLEDAFMAMLIEMPRPEVELTVPSRGGRRQGASKGESLSRVKKRVHKIVECLKPDPPRKKRHSANHTERESDDGSSSEEAEAQDFDELHRLKQAKLLSEQLQNASAQLRLLCVNDGNEKYRRTLRTLLNHQVCLFYTCNF